MRFGSIFGILNDNNSEEKTMNLWNKIVLGFKFFFRGFESATDYALMLLNEYLLSDGV